MRAEAGSAEPVSRASPSGCPSRTRRALGQDGRRRRRRVRRRRGARPCSSSARAPPWQRRSPSSTARSESSRCSATPPRLERVRAGAREGSRQRARSRHPHGAVARGERAESRSAARALDAPRSSPGSFSRPVLEAIVGGWRSALRRRRRLLRTEGRFAAPRHGPRSGRRRQELAAGEGADRAIAAGVPVVAERAPAGRRPCTTRRDGFAAAIAAPMSWAGETRGVLARRSGATPSGRSASRPRRACDVRDARDARAPKCGELRAARAPRAGRERLLAHRQPARRARLGHGDARRRRPGRRRGVWRRPRRGDHGGTRGRIASRARTPLPSASRSAFAGGLPDGRRSARSRRTGGADDRGLGARRRRSVRRGVPRGRGVGVAARDPDRRAHGRTARPRARPLPRAAAIQRRRSRPRRPARGAGQGGARAERAVRRRAALAPPRAAARPEREPLLR